MPRACEKLEDYDVKEMIWKADLEDDGSADHEQETINETDAYGDSTIDLPEFLPLMVGKVKKTFTEEELVESFKVFDDDENGFGGAAESQRRTTNVGDKVAFLLRKGEMTNRLIKRADDEMIVTTRTTSSTSDGEESKRDLDGSGENEKQDNMKSCKAGTDIAHTARMTICGVPDDRVVNNLKSGDVVHAKGR